MNIHFISIGGSVMHQLAIALKRKGYRVTGSDDEIFEPSRTNLEKESILPAAIGWDPERVTPDLDAVILGMHARLDNPELVRAQELGLPVYSFPEYIFQESRFKKRVVVGGSHGKTTTTSMIMHVLKTAGKDFDYLVGARLEGFDQSVKVTEAPLIVCEGDEYPASAVEKRPKFHFLFPEIAVLTGIAWDHINVFPTFDFYLEQFRIFIGMIEEGGTLIYNETDPVLKELVESAGRTDITLKPYGVPAHSIEKGGTILKLGGRDTSLEVFGAHNLMNLNAAWLVVEELGLSLEQFLVGITGFTGAARRLEKIGEKEGLVVYRDFAHAPSKVKATVQAVRAQFPERQLLALFELHTYSSLNADFMKEYAGALDGADKAVVFFSAHALEIKKMPPLDPNVVKEGFSLPGLEVINDPQVLESWLKAQNFADTVLLFMSSGNYGGFNILTFAQQITAQSQ
ncbi:UDP-N-acetylmuramate--L-alanine ligase [Parasegetibacter sp. NRK P23]|uniref:UDP-N-acetylmuramate--L-alanine ligase n=1 Tax=Parasegetibacter sp. NRK P23 TaxID=2942999 RepID=UPI002044980A|nr:Mur ligase family protein [Parasegetibacter sp. NRK P23]MCM5528526.1 Mur ligase family protein [Parasegetibacter sp. NRK P23]